MLPEVKTGRLIRKRHHDPQGLRDVDPNFGEERDEAKHGKVLRYELKIEHLTEFQQEILTAVVKMSVRLILGTQSQLGVKPLLLAPTRRQ